MYIINMPNFGTPYSGLKYDKKISKTELIRSIRFLIAAEYEAVQMYTQLAESTDNKLAISVLSDITNEERVHAGEFLRLLKQLDPSESDYYEQGSKEVEKIITNLR